METTMLKDALTVIHERKSVRHFTGEPVPETSIMVLLHAAMAAPTAINLPPWKFIIVTDREKLKTLADGLPYAKMLVSAGTGIVVCTAPKEAAMGNEAVAVIDSTCASENLLLAAEALGLGAVWTAVYPDKQAMEFVSNQLSIPHGIIPINLIPVGHPAGEEQAKDKFDESNIHWNQW